MSLRIYSKRSYIEGGELGEGERGKEREREKDRERERKKKEVRRKTSGGRVLVDQYVNELSSSTVGLDLSPFCHPS